MGIRNLNKWVSTTTPAACTAVSWSDYSGRRIGVDILSFLYRFKHIHETDAVAATVAVAATETATAITVIAEMIRVWRAANIEPIFVFDGKTPAEKRLTSMRRRETKRREGVQGVSSGERNEVKQFLYMCGIMSLNAEHEADTVLAHLARTGEIAAVVSSDMDFLARGVGHLICPDANNGSQWTDIHLERILSDADMTYTQFVGMCVLMGCDYAPAIPITPLVAYWTVRRGQTLTECLMRMGIRTTTAWEKAYRVLKGDDDCWETMLSERQREKWYAGPPPPEPMALDQLVGSTAASSLLAAA